MPAAAGFWFGILFLLLLDRAVPHMHMNSSKAEGAALTILAADFVVPLLPYLLNFAAGFTVMMALDVALG